MRGLRIGELARRGGVTAATVRYYERAGVLLPPPRSAAGYRLYGERAVEELVFVRRAQGLGFTLDEIRELLDLSRRGSPPCGRVLALAEQHLEAVDRRIRELRAYRRRLGGLVRRWRRGGPCRFTSSGLCDLVAAAPLPASTDGVRPRPGRP